MSFLFISLKLFVREEHALATHNINVESPFIEIPSCTFFGGKKVRIGCVYRAPDTDIGIFNDALASRF